MLRQPVFKSCGKAGSMSPLRNQAGMTLVVGVLLLTVLALLAVAATSITKSDMDRAEVYQHTRTALYIADAGVEHAKSILKTQAFTSILAANGLLAAVGSDAVIDGKTYSQASFNNGTYSVRVYDNDDGDGSLTADADGMVGIESIGLSSNGTRKKIVAFVRKADLDLDDFPAAMSLVDDHAGIEAGGNYSVGGSPAVPKPDNPHQYDPIPDPDPACGTKYGIATNASPANTSVDEHGSGDITGMGGDPDIHYNDSAFTLAKLQDVRAAFVAAADTVYGNNPGSVDLGSDANPKIVHVQGSAQITGNIYGAGVLIVDGELETGGGFTYQGIVLVGICNTCAGRYKAGVGTSRIYGAMVVANPTSSYSGETQVDLGGTLEVHYSCTALLKSKDELNSTFKTVSWKES